MDRVKKIYAYLDKMIDACIRLCTEDPYYSYLPYYKFDWGYYVYGEFKELLTVDVPIALVNYVSITHYVDYNLFHEELTGCYIICILYLVNKTPMYWYSNKQSTVETDTYGSDFFLPVNVCKISLI